MFVWISSRTRDFNNSLKIWRKKSHKEKSTRLIRGIGVMRWGKYQIYFYCVSISSHFLFIFTLYDAEHQKSLEFTSEQPIIIKKETLKTDHTTTWDILKSPLFNFLSLLDQLFVMCLCVGMWYNNNNKTIYYNIYFFTKKKTHSSSTSTLFECVCGVCVCGSTWWIIVFWWFCLFLFVICDFLLNFYTNQVSS